MKKILSAILSAVTAFSIFCTPVQAEENSTPSGIEFVNIGTEIDSYAAENEDSFASFAAAVFSGDEVLYSSHFGFIDRENQIAADENSVYEWGSISKMFVWVSVMQLHEQGKLDLEADIQTYLPEGFLTKLKYDEPITMINLMNHNAGCSCTPLYYRRSKCNCLLYFRCIYCKGTLYSKENEKICTCEIRCFRPLQSFYSWFCCVFSAV